MLEPVLSNPWVRAVGVLLSIILFSIIVYLLSPVLVPLFFAFTVAYILDPVVDLLEARKMSRTRSIFWLGTVMLVALLAVPAILVPGIIGQAEELRARATDLPDTGTALELVRRLPLDRLVENLGWAPEAQETPASGELPDEASPQNEEGDEASPQNEEGDEASDESEGPGAPPAEVPPAEEAADTPHYDPLEVLVQGISDRIREPAVQFLRSNAFQLVSFGETAGMGLGQILSTLGSALLKAALSIGSFLLFAFVAAYLLRDYDLIVAAVRDLVPKQYAAKTSAIFSKIDSQLRAFLRGQLVVCMCLGSMYALGLFIAGVPFWALIGLFGALASFVPYLGLALTIGPAVGLCFVQYHGIDWHMGVVVATFVVAQILEGTVLTPKIVGDKVGLGPVWVILAVLVFGNALGFLGLLLAVPIAAALKVIVVELVAAYKASDFYGGSVAP